jgi:hypothetical protein
MSSYPHIVDVKWRLDYRIKVIDILDKKINKLIFLI